MMLADRYNAAIWILCFSESKDDTIGEEPHHFCRFGGSFSGASAMHTIARTGRRGALRVMPLSRIAAAA
jgi:hypothetical protein